MSDEESTEDEFEEATEQVGTARAVFFGRRQ